MPIILLHSSKTMRAHTGQAALQQPALMPQTKQLAAYVQSLSTQQIARCMSLSDKKAALTYDLWHAWSSAPSGQSPAIDSFIGDIYSGLQVQTFTADDRTYANKHLFILSGLYGVLRALDGIAPYRLEMGYILPDEPYRSLYRFWGGSIARQLPAHSTIFNLSALEYTKAILPYLPGAKVISPKFLTRNAAGEPVFVVVHAKIARGAFARWLIKNRAQDSADITHFSDIGYYYDSGLSTPEQPVFVCDTFGGLGLSVRLT